MRRYILCDLINYARAGRAHASDDKGRGTMKKRNGSWDTMYRALESYRKAEGHANVPANYKPKPALGRWVATQRYKRKVGELDEAQIKLLDKLDFVWAPADRAWGAMFRELQEFRQKQGHCDVPSQWEENPHLSNWVASQRHRRKKGSLPAERVRRLDEVGFVWSIYGCGTVRKLAKANPDPASASPPAEEPPSAEERLYHVGRGAYVQHNGRDELPARLAKYASEHRGELPPYIPLACRQTAFRVGEEGAVAGRKVVWSGKGPLPESVLEYVRENGILPPHD